LFSIIGLRPNALAILAIFSIEGFSTAFLIDTLRPERLEIDLSK
jgi:hypothetical protein